MADITITDRQVNSFFVQVSALFFFCGALVSGLATYFIWTDNTLTNETVIRIGALASTATLFFLSLGLFFVHKPKESEYEKKEKELYPGGPN